MVLKHNKLEFLQVLSPWHRLAWHLGLKNANNPDSYSSSVISGMALNFYTHTLNSLNLPLSHSVLLSHHGFSLSLSESPSHSLNFAIITLSISFSVLLSISLSLSLSLSLFLLVSLSVLLSLCTLPLSHTLYSYSQSTSSIWNHKVCLLI